MIKPSDGEVEFLSAVNVRLGAGTRARISSIKAKRTGTDTEIVATLELRATVTLGNPDEFSHACGCGATPPPPDQDGLWYIIQNHDGGRIVFPVPEVEAYEDPERDQYPVAGWKRLDDMDVCGECYAAMQEALKVRRKKR